MLAYFITDYIEYPDPNDAKSTLRGPRGLFKIDGTELPWALVKAGVRKDCCIVVVDVNQKQLEEISSTPGVTYLGSDTHINTEATHTKIPPIQKNTFVSGKVFAEAIVTEYEKIERATIRGIR